MEHWRLARSRARSSIALILTLILAMLGAAPPGPARAAGVIYVRPGGLGGGTSWPKAFPRLQGALAAAVSGDEIWVAAGSYTPGALRTDSFQLKDGVAIYGGFAGTETLRDQRDWAANVVTLSGDLLGDDGPDFANNAENSYHVVTGANNATLDGVTISGGNANGATPNYDGGGMYNSNSSPTLRNVIISGNSAGGHGGGMYNEASSPTLIDIMISANSAPYGGGVANLRWSRPTLTNVTISANSATLGGGMGNDRSDVTFINVVFSGNRATSAGGMYNYVSSPMLTNATISGNTASSDGGGLMSFGGSPVLTNVIISGNSAASKGGGIYYSSNNPVLTNVTISGNSATYGGGMYNWNGSNPQIHSSIIWGNIAPNGPSILNESTLLPSNPSISYSLVQGAGGSGAWSAAFGTDGGGNLDADPLFVAPLPFPPYIGATSNLRLRVGSPALDAGNNVGVAATDLDGQARIVGGAVDMGAYERQPPGLRYVKWDATGRGSGYSWADAMPSLAEALAFAGSGDELWVAAGSYRPGRNRSDSFLLKAGVALYGGFAGSETLRDQRDWAANLTVLSGDIGTSGVSTDNSYHVVTGATGATLDGVTVSGGNADMGLCPGTGCGGGMYNTGSSPTLANITFSGNSTATNGGGMYNSNSSPTLANVTFSANSAGGLFYSGGGMYNVDSSPTLTNVVFSTNSAGYGGGIASLRGSPTLLNVTISGNSAETSGGGVYNLISSPTIRNSIIWGNTAATSRPAIYDVSATPSVSYSLVQGGYAGAGNLDTDPLFVAPVPAAPSPGGNLRLRASSPAINAGESTGVAATDLDGHPRVVGGTVDMGAYEVQFPSVLSITRAGPSPTNAATVAFTVIINMPILVVDSRDIALTTTGGQGGATTRGITGTTTSTTTVTATVNTVANQVGTIRLDVIDHDGIFGGGVSLGGPGDGNGDFSAGEAYLVDREPPETALISGPGGVTSSTGALIAFGGDDGEGVGLSGFECRLDGGGFAPCASPLSLSGLAEGDHSFEARALDALGNADPSPASATWRVDSTAPALSINPPGPINIANRAGYLLAGTCTPGDDLVMIAVGSVSGESVCAAGAFSASLDVSSLSDGPAIAVSARQADAAGNLGSAAAATRKDTVAPTATLSSPAPDPTDGSPIPVSVTFSEAVEGFTADDLAVTNATLAGFGGGGANYSFALTPAGNGAVIAAIAAGAAADLAGNPSLAADPLSRRYTGFAPGASVIFMPVAASVPALPDLVVERIETAEGRLSLTILNQGDAAVADGFWVDLLIAPARAPARLNDTWDALGARGLSWGVTARLAPGERLRLTFGDGFYRADYSRPGGPIGAGTVLYAHVDAASTASGYGGVLETHERAGVAYNNILGPSVAQTQIDFVTLAAAPAAGPSGVLPRR